MITKLFSLPNQNEWQISSNIFRTHHLEHQKGYHSDGIFRDCDKAPLGGFNLPPNFYPNLPATVYNVLEAIFTIDSIRRSFNTLLATF